MKTSELIDAALDWAVCMAKGCTYTIDIWLYEYKHLEGPRYSTDWSRGGPIIERELLDVCPYDTNGLGWRCTKRNADYTKSPDRYHSAEFGPTPLVAAMRCYVASKLGDEIEIPEDLK